MKHTHDNIQPKIHVLVTAAGGPAGINALRLLERHEHIKKFATDSDSLAIGRSLSHDFAPMAKYKETQAYQASLRDLVAKWDIDVVLPTLAEEMVSIADVLKDTGVEVIVSPKKTVELCDDKRELYRFIQQVMPQHTARWQTLDMPISLDQEYYFLKPAYGRGGSGCRLIGAQELAVLQSVLPDPETWIIMELLPGTEWTVDAYVAKDGSVPFIVPRERIEVKGGISLKGKTVKHENVIALTRELLQHMPSRGPVCIQWKTAQDGTIKFVEMNPRLSGGAMITALSGADPMQCLVDELAGRTPEPPVWEEKTVVGYFEYKSL